MNKRLFGKIKRAGFVSSPVIIGAILVLGLLSGIVRQAPLMTLSIFILCFLVLLYKDLKLLMIQFHFEDWICYTKLFDRIG
jgi:hypothetical protein